ncbi:Poly-beta-1,6-N-acetyl-D-glucosamine synthase [Lacunisphaera limnophila]|uniref:Poly-beta-1,6-N-acetyl-D-glucosamine synthase n=1 Tax=Lacunisphaera limnophila TaxID=1838286 RepID=A0A1D8AU32_9BACT|nr:glycosyltransferase [Lacunisphaera limnophila]AOS44366.1 Poly-beta-1,6-N-acetyl-D-glucosamine synthase [Lacunisphaera limnophila]
MNGPTFLAALTLLIWLGLAWDVGRGNRRLRRLAKLPLPEQAGWPRVSLVIAARNEGKTLGAAVPTMLALDYPDLELIAVNDRSEDDTGAVLEKLAAADPRLRVVTVTALPEGWIGKNHALHTGAIEAAGEWILFTDADIHFQPDTLRRAVAYARMQTLDHLAAVPRLVEQGHALGICVNAFSFAFTVGLRPAHISDPRSRAHGGVGAFNLVRSSTYRKLGGHEPVRMRPDDDIKLGKLMKAGGFSELVLGEGALAVAWYDSVGAMIRGLTKNAYAGADYRLWVPLAAMLAFGVGWVWPAVALFLYEGPAMWLNAGTLALILALGCDQTRFTGGRWWHGLFLPLGMAVFAWILLRSQAVTLWTGGITWRGTHYPLRDLKANRL